MVDRIHSIAPLSVKCTNGDHKQRRTCGEAPMLMEEDSRMKLHDTIQCRRGNGTGKSHFERVS